MCVHCTCWNASETIARMEEGSLNSVLRCIFLWSANYKVYWCTLQQGRVLVSFGIFCCFFLYEVHFGTFEQISSKFWPGEAWNRGSRCLHRVIESFHFLLNSITVHHLCSQSSSFFYDVYTGTLIIKVSHSDGKNQVATLEQGCLPEMPGSTIPKFGSPTFKINIYFKTNWPPIVFTAFHTRSHWSFAFSSHYDVLCGLNRGLGREKGNN